jgi:hypothetical protein
MSSKHVQPLCSVFCSQLDRTRRDMVISSMLNVSCHLETIGSSCALLVKLGYHMRS